MLCHVRHLAMRHLLSLVDTNLLRFMLNTAVQKVSIDINKPLIMIFSDFY